MQHLFHKQSQQMLIDLENGTVVPTANANAPQPLYSPYDNWAEMLECDQLAHDEICARYLGFLNK